MGWGAHNPNALGSIVPAFGGGAGGGGSGAARDHQTAKYIVGNALSGDTLAVCDFLDPGNGTGIAAALAAASVVGPALGDVYLRPGFYDLGAVGAPALPLACPPLCTLRSSAQLAVPPGGGFAPNGAVIVVGAARHVLGVGGMGFSFMTIENVAFALADVALPSGAQVIGGAGNIVVVLRNVQFVLPDALQDVGLTALVSTPSSTLNVRGGGCGQFGAPATLPTNAYDAGPGNVHLVDVSINGVTTAVTAGAGVVQGGQFSCVNGIAFAGGGVGVDTYFNVQGVTMELGVGGVGVQVDGDTRGIVGGCRMRGNGTQTGVTGTSTDITVSGCNLRGMASGVDLASTRAVVAGCALQDCAVGVTLSDALLSGAVTGNRIQGTGAHGIQVAGVDCVVSGNAVVGGAYTTGVDLTATSAGVAVVANRIEAVTPIVDVGAGNLTVANLT